MKPYSLKIWDKNGREINPLKGKIVPAGSFIQKGDEFITLETDHIFGVEALEPNDMGVSTGSKWVIRPLRK